MASRPDNGRQIVVRKAIADHLAAMRPGDRLPSIRSMMDMYGTTQVTIERCLGYFEGRGRIVRKARSGTFVAETSTADKTRLNDKALGVIVPSLTAAAFGTSSFLEGLEGCAAAAGWMVQICNAERGQEHELQFFGRCAKNGTQGLIVYPSTWNILSDEYCDEVRKFVWEKKLSVVCVDLSIPGVGCDLATSDDVGAYDQVTNILLKQGRRRLCYVEAAAGIISAKRLAGVQRAIGNGNRGEVTLSRISASLDRVRGDDRNVAATARCLADQLPADVDAVIVGSTVLYEAVLRMIELTGRTIGDDLAVAASLIDHAPPCTVPVIELRKQNNRIARKAFELVTARLANPDRMPVECRIPFEIVDPYERK